MIISDYKGKNTSVTKIKINCMRYFQVLLKKDWYKS